MGKIFDFRKYKRAHRYTIMSLSLGKYENGKCHLVRNFSEMGIRVSNFKAEQHAADNQIGEIFQKFTNQVRKLSIECTETR